MSHLIDEPPILFYPSLAALIGVNEAIILQQIHFLLTSVEKDEREYNFVDGRWWAYNNLKRWQAKFFPWLNEYTISRKFTALEDMGVVLSMQSVKSASDRTKWYSIDYDALGRISAPILRKAQDASGGNSKMITVPNPQDDSKETPEETPEDQEITRPPAGIPFGMKTHISAEPSPAEVKPAKIKTQPALAQRIANYVYDIPKIAKGKLALIAEQCKRYNDDAIYASWIDTTFLPSKVKMGDNGKKTPLMSMDDLLVMLIAEEGFAEYKRIHTSKAAPSHDNLIPDDMFAEI